MLPAAVALILCKSVQYLRSFPLNRGGGFAGYVVHDAADALDLVDDARGDDAEDLMRYGRVLAGHEVRGAHSAQSQSIVIGAEVAHDADRAHVREHGEILVGLYAAAGDLLAEDGVRLAEYGKLLLGYLAHDAYGEAGAGEGLALDKASGQAKLTAKRANLILEKAAQRFNHALKAHILRQAADVMMAFYRGGLAAAGLDNVRVNGALREKADVGKLLRLLLKHAHELRADDLALSLRVGHAAERRKEALLCVGADEVQVAALERLFDLVSLVLAHETVIDEDAVELAGDGLGEQRSAHGGIHTAGEAEDDMRVADLRAHAFDKLKLEVFQIIIPRRAAGVIEEAADHGGAVGRAFDLGVELEGIEAAGIVCHGGVGAGFRMGDGDEALRQDVYLVGMAHKADLRSVKPFKQEGRRVHAHSGLAVLAGGAGGDLAAERPCHQLCAVAYAEHGNAKLEDLLLAMGRGRIVNTVRAAGENDADGRDAAHLVRGDITRAHDGIHRAFAHAPCDKLLILSAEIQNQNALRRHFIPPPLLFLN